MKYRNYFKQWFRHNFSILRLTDSGGILLSEEEWKADINQAYIAGIRKGIKLSKENSNV